MWRAARLIAPSPLFMHEIHIIRCLTTSLIQPFNCVAAGIHVFLSLQFQSLAESTWSFLVSYIPFPFVWHRFLARLVEKGYGTHQEHNIVFPLFPFLCSSFFAYPYFHLFSLPTSSILHKPLCAPDKDFFPFPLQGRPLCLDQPLSFLHPFHPPFHPLDFQLQEVVHQPPGFLLLLLYQGRCGWVGGLVCMSGRCVHPPTHPPIPSSFLPRARPGLAGRQGKGGWPLRLLEWKKRKRRRRRRRRRRGRRKRKRPA